MKKLAVLLVLLITVAGCSNEESMTQAKSETVTKETAEEKAEENTTTSDSLSKKEDNEDKTEEQNSEKEKKEPKRFTPVGKVKQYGNEGYTDIENYKDTEKIIKVETHNDLLYVYTFLKDRRFMVSIGKENKWVVKDKVIPTTDFIYSSFGGYFPKLIISDNQLFYKNKSGNLTITSLDEKGDLHDKNTIEVSGDPHFIDIRSDKNDMYYLEDDTGKYIISSQGEKTIKIKDPHEILGDIDVGYFNSKTNELNVVEQPRMHPYIYRINVITGEPLFDQEGKVKKVESPEIFEPLQMFAGEKDFFYYGQYSFISFHDKDTLNELVTKQFKYQIAGVSESEDRYHFYEATTFKLQPSILVQEYSK